MGKGRKGKVKCERRGNRKGTEHVWKKKQREGEERKQEGNVKRKFKEY